MSLARWAKRKDANQDAVVQALERVGAEIWILDRPCDIACWFRQRWFMLETKQPLGRYTKRQAADRALGLCAGIITVRTPLEALYAVGAIDEKPTITVNGTANAS